MRWLTLLACGLFVLPMLAHAGTGAPDARALALKEAMLGYCSKAAPSAAGKYEEQVKLLTRGASAETLAKVRHSREYRQAYKAEADFAGMVDQHNALRFCSGPPPRRK